MAGSESNFAEDGFTGADFGHVDLAGVRLHVARSGPSDGERVVLLHGFPDFWYGWRRQIGPLARAGYRVVAPDQRGYNLSDKPADVRAYGLDLLVDDVLRLVEAECGGRAHLVGHDWGGLVAWVAAARRPAAFRSLAILNAPAPSIMRAYALSHPSQAVRSAYVAFFQTPGLPEISLRARGHAAMRAALIGSSRRGTFDSQDLEFYLAAWRRPGALTAMLDWYRALVRAPPAPYDPRVRVPTLVIWGTRDDFLETGLAHASLRLCDSVRLIELDATHWVHLEEATSVNAQLMRFLSTCGGAPSPR